MIMLNLLMTNNKENTSKNIDINTVKSFGDE